MTDAQEEAEAIAEAASGAQGSNSGTERKKSTQYSDQWGVPDGDSHQADPPSNVLEVWFAGCHSDVGGGSVLDTEPHTLGNISLRWMVRQCIEAQCGILFDSALLQAAGIQPQLFVPKSDQLKLNFNLKVAIPETQKHDEAEGSTTTDEGYGTDDGRADDTNESDKKSKRKKKTKHVGELTLSPTRDHASPVESLEERERKDALAPIHDSLKERPVWWILELIPLMRTWQDKDGTWLNALTINRGRGRKIPPGAIPPKFHKSVQIRMKEHKDYKPQARWEGDPEWVE